MVVSRLLNQTCVIWEKSGRDAYGTKTFANPREAICKWTDEQSFYTDNAGMEQQSGCVIYMLPEDAPRNEEYIMLGSLDDTDSTYGPEDESTAIQVKKVLESFGVSAVSKLVRVLA
jgi:hypothetical protein